MKLSTTKGFDIGTVLQIFQKAKIEGLEDFVDAVASFSSEVTSALRNRLTVAENFAAIEREFSLRHNTDEFISQQGLSGTVRAIIPLKVLPYANPLTSFAWEYTITGQLRCRAKFEGAPSTACKVLLRMEI